MPLTPQAITAAIRTAAPDLQGPDFQRLAVVLGNAISAWAVLPANVVVRGTTAGAAGAGVVSGNLAVVPQAVILNNAFAGAGLLGPNGQQVARAVGIGVANAFTTSALYVGASAGVGSGTDASRISFANASTLTAAILAAGQGLGIAGNDFATLAAAVGTGVAALLLTATGIGAVAGPSGPAPAAGTSISKVV
jgi:hypothetical protein